MFPFEQNRHMLRASDPRNLIGDVLAEPLLQLQAMRKLLRNAREFREAQDLCVGNVANGDLTPEWQEMVLTERLASVRAFATALEEVCKAASSGRTLSMLASELLKSRVN